MEVFTSATPMVFGWALTLATFVLVVVLACFNPRDPLFFTFFKSFQSLGLEIRVRAGYSVCIRVTVCLSCFYQAYYSTALLSGITVMLQVAVE